MKNRVHIFAFFAESVNDRADGVGDSAREHKAESDGSHSLNGGREVDGDAPAHSDIADHRKDRILLPGQ